MKRDIQTDLLRRAVTASTESLVIADARQPDLPLVYVNPAFERLTGYRADEVLGRNCRFLQRDDARQAPLDHVREALRKGASCEVLLRNYRKDGTLFWNQLSLSPMLDASGRITHVMGLMADVSERVRLEQRLIEKQRQLEKTKRVLEGLALKDGLTGLYNRRHFAEQLAREWNRARREQLALSLFMIDIDHFKRFNDTYGHLAGDQCIKLVGETIQRCFARGSDLVARYGGEEFVALAAGVERRQARERAELLREAIRELTGERNARAAQLVTVSVGLATATPDDRLAPEDMLDAADRALYQAKRQGRDRVVLAPALRTLATAVQRPLATAA
jgi:diguanylate cyclase (GGDEF)-like protein/PAS domain S-box-containing protein